MTTTKITTKISKLQSNMSLLINILFIKMDEKERERENPEIKILIKGRGDKLKAWN